MDACPINAEDTTRKTHIGKSHIGKIHIGKTDIELDIVLV